MARVNLSGGCYGGYNLSVARVLHIHNVANQSTAICSGLRALGHHSEVWEYSQTQAEKFPPDRFIGDDPNIIEVWDAFEEARRSFDVFHFHGNRSFIWRDFPGLPSYWDLPILKALGKKVFFTFHGSEIRLKSMATQLYEWSYYKFADVPCDEDDIQRRHDLIQSYADGTFVCSLLNLSYTPDSEWHPLAIDLSEWPVVGPVRERRPRVLHPWKDNPAKGVRFIRDGLVQLEAEGVQFEAVYLDRVSHAEAKRELAAADVVVDNVVAGTYGVVSLEAMACGKPTVAQLEAPVTERLPDVPVQNCNPTSFVETMRGLLADPGLRSDLGRRGRAFVERHHDHLSVATWLLSRYEQSPRVVRATLPDWFTRRQVDSLEIQLEQTRSQLAKRDDVVRKRGETIAKHRETIAKHRERVTDLREAIQRLREANSRQSKRIEQLQLARETLRTSVQELRVALYPHRYLGYLLRALLRRIGRFWSLGRRLP